MAEKLAFNQGLDGTSRFQHFRAHFRVDALECNYCFCSVLIGASAEIDQGWSFGEKTLCKSEILVTSRSPIGCDEPDPNDLQARIFQQNELNGI